MKKWDKGRPDRWPDPWEQSHPPPTKPNLEKLTEQLHSLVIPAELAGQPINETLQDEHRRILYTLNRQRLDSLLPVFLHDLNAIINDCIFNNKFFKQQSYSDALLAACDAMMEWKRRGEKMAIRSFVAMKMQNALSIENDNYRQRLKRNATLTGLWSLIVGEADDQWGRFASEQRLPVRYYKERNKEQSKRDWTPRPQKRESELPSPNTVRLTALRAIARNITPDDFKLAIQDVAGRYTLADLAYERFVDTYYRQAGRAFWARLNFDPPRYLTKREENVTDDPADSSVHVEWEAVFDYCRDELDRDVAKAIHAGHVTDEAIAVEVGASRPQVNRARQRIRELCREIMA